MSFGSPNRINYLLPSQRIVNTICNLNIRAGMSIHERINWTLHAPQDVWLLEAFGQPGRPRSQCNVTLEVHPSTKRERLAGFCGHLALFSEFETVVVRAKVNWPEPDPLASSPVGFLWGKAAEAWLKQRKTTAVR